MKNPYRADRFVAEYLVDLNATQAAIRAGYSERTARQIGAENLTKPVIGEKIREAMKQRVARTQVDADFVLRHLRDQLNADINDIFADDNRILPLAKWPAVFRKGLVTSFWYRQHLLPNGNGEIEIGHISFADRYSLMLLIGRHLGLNW
jgi:phage terminase small subunit